MATLHSKDGTRIFYDKIGRGPGLIVIGGALSARDGGRPLAEILAEDFTVYSFDRRGRGDSSDTGPYSVAREIEDVQALMESAGGPVFVYGASSGGALALETALRVPGKVRRLAVYEVPYDSSDAGVKAWRDYCARFEALLAAGRREDALVLFLEFVGMPAAALDGMRKTPAWKGMVALAPTIAYDNAILGDSRKVPVERAATLTVPTLLMDGAASLQAMPFMRVTAEALAKAIPKARHRVLEGQGHGADPKALAPVLKEFFLEGL